MAAPRSRSKRPGTGFKSRRARPARRLGREKQRARVIAAALRLATRRSFQDLTVDEIARSAGLSRTAFYTHFPDKHQLLLAAVDEVSVELYGMADRWWHGVGPPAERVRRAVEGVVGIYAQQVGLLRVATEVSTYDRELREVWLAIAQRFIDATADHIRAEQDGGLIPRSLDPTATAGALFWMVERCCYVQLALGGRTPADVVEGLAPVWTLALYPGAISAGRLSPGG